MRITWLLLDLDGLASPLLRRSIVIVGLGSTLTRRLGSSLRRLALFAFNLSVGLELGFTPRSLRGLGKSLDGAVIGSHKLVLDLRPGVCSRLGVGHLGKPSEVFVINLDSSLALT